MMEEEGRGVRRCRSGSGDVDLAKSRGEVGGSEANDDGDVGELTRLQAKTALVGVEVVVATVVTLRDLGRLR